MPLKASIPPQQLLQLAAAEPLPTPQQHDDKPSFSFPMNDDVTDPLAWLNDRTLFFRGQHTPNNIKIGYEIFHLIEIAHLQYMHLTEDKAATDGEHFVPAPTSTSAPQLEVICGRSGSRSTSTPLVTSTPPTSSTPATTCSSPQV
jgi:hypothetical protein